MPVKVCHHQISYHIAQQTLQVTTLPVLGDKIRQIWEAVLFRSLNLFKCYLPHLKEGIVNLKKKKKKKKDLISKVYDF